MIDLPIPDLFSFKTVLCVQPHPDDTDIAIGATIAQMCESGARVVYVSVTDDAAGLSGDQAHLSYAERVQLRREEQLEAARILGVADVVELGFPDAGDWREIEARNRIVAVIREVQPDILLTVDPWMRYEAHGDHRRTGLAAAEAAILQGFDAIPGSNEPGPEDYHLNAVGFFFTENPNTYVASGPWRERKAKALAAHDSQWSKEDLDRLLAYDEWRGGYYGSRIDADYAEALLVVPTDWLHVFPELVSVINR